jgi:hypothetical protein
MAFCLAMGMVVVRGDNLEFNLKVVHELLAEV